MRLIYHPDAESELIDAARYYESRVATLGIHMLFTIDSFLTAFTYLPSSITAGTLIIGGIACLNENGYSYLKIQSDG